MATKKPKGLGRGLDALLGADTHSLEQIGQTTTSSQKPNTLLVTQLQAGKYQPRTRMDEGALAELAEDGNVLAEVGTDETEGLYLVFASDDQPTLIMAVSGWIMSTWDELPDYED